MKAERRISISSNLILHGRAVVRLRRAVPTEPLLSRWYVPWLATALALAGLLVTAISALEIVTATPQPPLTPVRRPAPADLPADVEMVEAETLIRRDR